MLEAIVRLVHDLIDGEGRRGPIRIPGVVLGQFGRDAVQPFLQHVGRPRIECGKRTDHASLALRNHQVRIGNDEQGRAHHRKRQTVFQDGGKGHENLQGERKQWVVVRGSGLGVRRVASVAHRRPLLARSAALGISLVALLAAVQQTIVQ